MHIWWNEDGDRCTEGLVIAEAGGEWAKDLFKRVGRFRVSLDNEEGSEAFYGVQAEDLGRRSLDEIDGFLKKQVIPVV